MTSSNDLPSSAPAPLSSVPASVAAEAVYPFGISEPVSSEEIARTAALCRGLVLRVRNVVFSRLAPRNKSLDEQTDRGAWWTWVNRWLDGAGEVSERDPHRPWIVEANLATGMFTVLQRIEGACRRCDGSDMIRDLTVSATLSMLKANAAYLAMYANTAERPGGAGMDRYTVERSGKLAGEMEGLFAELRKLEGEDES